MRPTHWTEAEDHLESLAVCLRTVLAGLHVERPYDELVATLGLGAATVAAPHDSLESWSTYARDASLVNTAQLYGLRLRGLHPPAAAPGLDHAAEYAGHFRDSYVPLISQALAHEQLALAWRGWPAPSDRLWGVLTHVQGGQLFGQAPGHSGRPVPLTGPAFQVYIVEESQPPMREALSPDVLFAHVARQACEAWAGTWAPDSGVLTGPAAYDAWQDTLRSAPAANAGKSPLHVQHSHATRLLVAARCCLAAWLRRVSGRQRELAARWADACDRVVQHLRPYQSPDAARATLAQPAGIKHVCRALDNASALEADTVKQLESAR